MIKIAICEDLNIQLEKNKEIVQGTFGELGIEFEIDTYLSGVELVKTYEGGKRYNLILIDYCMDEMNGIDAVKIIRRVDEDVKIIFVSSYIDPAPDTFEIGAFRYIVKGQDFERKLKKALMEAERKINAQNKMLEIKEEENTYLLFAKDILCFEARFKKIMVTTKEKEEELKARRTLDSLEQEFNNYGFARVHRSFLINMEYIKGVHNNEVNLRNGRTIPVGDKYRDEFLKKYRNWAFMM